MDPVIIAGAGPVGLALAHCLARHSVPSIVLDQTGEPGRTGLPEPAQRTVVLGRETVELLERLGCRRMVGAGAVWSGWRTLRRRQEVLRVGLDSADAPLHIAQHWIERGLRAAFDGQGLVRLVPGARVAQLEMDEKGVSVQTCGPGGKWWRGSYLVGCDGSRSTVRKLLGVGFPGRTAVDRYVVAALQTELPSSREGLLHLEPPGAGMGAEVTARPLPDGVWRVDWLLSAGGSVLTPDELVTRIRATLTAWCGNVPPYDLLGSGEYAVHQRVARQWRVGRAFLAGDAAHLMGTLGTRNLEEGLRDAENLAWKLSVTWHQGASDVLLDSYQAERRGSVGARLRATDQVLPLVRADGPWRTVRRTVLTGSVRRYAGLVTDSHLGRGPLGGPPNYPRSPLTPVAEDASARCATPPGASVEDVPVTTLDGTGTRLRERLGRNLLVVLVAPGTGVWDSRHWLRAGLMPQLAKTVEALPVPAELLVAEAYPGAAAHSVLLVRPDGFLVSVVASSRLAELYDHVNHARGGPPLALEDRVPR